MDRVIIQPKLYITIMAGGLGKRMGSNLPKVLHKVKGVPMIIHIVREAIKLYPDKIIIIVGKYLKQIRNTITNHNIDNITYAYQAEPSGTGDAIKSTLHILDNETNIILSGDTPLIKYRTIKNIYNNFTKHNHELQVTCINLENPFGNGRIVKDGNGIFEKIVEEKDCSDDERKIKLVNCGIYVANSIILKKYIPNIKNENAQKEYYLTDIVKLYKDSEQKDVGLFQLNDEQNIEISNINTKKQLEDVEQLKIY